MPPASKPAANLKILNCGCYVTAARPDQHRRQPRLASRLARSLRRSAATTTPAGAHSPLARFPAARRAAAARRPRPIRRRIIQAPGPPGSTPRPPTPPPTLTCGSTQATRRSPPSWPAPPARHPPDRAVRRRDRPLRAPRPRLEGRPHHRRLPRLRPPLVSVAPPPPGPRPLPRLRHPLTGSPRLLGESPALRAQRGRAVVVNLRSAGVQSMADIAKVTVTLVRAR